jgi:cytochrome c oxidase assembly protein subunit 15
MEVSHPQSRLTTDGRSKALYGFAIFTAWCTFGLIYVGGLVTSTGSGLAVPDWPLAFGQVFPPMVGGVFYEHGHRMVASFVGFLTVVLTVWIWVRDSRKWVRMLALAGVGAVVLQGLLGGATVLLELPTAVSVSHALLAQAFLCATVALAMVTNPKWGTRPRLPTERGKSSLAWISVATTAVIFLQLLLGALMRHTHAGLAIPDFPLAFGRLIPPLSDPKVVVHFLHRLGALAVVVFVVWTVARVIRRHPDEPDLVWPAGCLIGLVALQIVLGGLVIWTRMAVVPTTSHVAVGAAVLALSFFLTLRLYEVQPTRSPMKTGRLITEQVPV